MSRYHSGLVWLTAAVLVISLAGAVLAAPIVVRIESLGVAQVLRVQSGAYGGQARSSGRLGYHFDNERIYWADTRSGGYTLFWLDPTLSGDVGGTHDSKTGRAQHWDANREMYAGTVTGLEVGAPRIV